MASSADLRWKLFDDSFIVFNRASGQTHFLNATAGEVLRLIAHEPSDASGLVTGVSVRLGLADTRDLENGIDALLCELEQLGLIQAKL